LRLEFKGEKQHRIWCRPSSPPFNAIRLLPAPFNQTLANSYFADSYQEELVQSYLDNINLLYVAFTRPKSNLIIFSQSPSSSSKKGEKETKENICKTISDLLFKGLDIMKWQPAGTLCPYEAPLSEKNTTPLLRSGSDRFVSFKSFSRTAHFRQSTHSSAFSNGYGVKGFHTPYIDEGKLMHRLFSDIRTNEEIPQAVAKLVYEGLISSDQEEEMQAFIRQAISSSGVSRWFTGDCTLFNECSILYRNTAGEIVQKRPDRVMLKDGIVEVVDFKFGKPQTSHHHQVKKYIDLLRQMGYPVVTGYLWYVKEGTVETVWTD
jgi:ATP-dependent exoDNAse (exonuclease V) beta subunit